MLKLIPDGKAALRVLCIGAHADDIEIGCGGTLLELLRGRRPLDLTWVVLSAIGARANEAQNSAMKFLGLARRSALKLGQFRDGYFPGQHAALKEYFEQLKRAVNPDLIFTHLREDLHQDHRLVCELTWNTFRDQLILEYEIPKYDGDLGRPNVFVPLSKAALRRKVSLLMRGFATQRSKAWFSEDTFVALARLRGIECRAPGGHAEAFVARKIVL